MIFFTIGLNKINQLNSLTHTIWPETNKRSNIDLMVTWPDYNDDMVLFVVSMIPGTTQLQTQSLNLGRERRDEKNFGMALLDANTGYRIYLAPAYQVQKTIDYLTAYKQGIRYNNNLIANTLINPITGYQMLFVASVNPELGTPLPDSVDADGDRIIHVELARYNHENVQKNGFAPYIDSPTYIFGH